MTEESKNSKSVLPKVLYVGLVLTMVTVGIFLIFRFGYEPAPTPIMKPSFFDKPEEIGAVVYRRFYAPIEEKGRVFFGVPPQPEYFRGVVRGFLLAAVAENRPFDVVLTDPEMPTLDVSGLSGLEVRSVPLNTVTQAEIIDQLNALKKDGKRVLVYTASIFSTHLLKGNPMQRLEAALGGEHFLSFSAGPLALRPDQEILVDPPCVGSQRDVNGTAEYGCVMLKTGRQFYRKQIEQTRYVAVMNSPAREDYLLLISFPGQGNRAQQ